MFGFAITGKVSGHKWKDGLEERLRDFNAEADLPFDFKPAGFKISAPPVTGTSWHKKNCARHRAHAGAA
jgi:hypothetical protein